MSVVKSNVLVMAILIDAVLVMDAPLAGSSSLVSAVLLLELCIGSVESTRL